MLSKDEAKSERYFSNDEARQCKATDYAKKNGAKVLGGSKNNAGYSVWWLRSLGGKRVRYVNSFGMLKHSHVHYNTGVVRPALWIKL